MHRIVLLSPIRDMRPVPSQPIVHPIHPHFLLLIQSKATVQWQTDTTNKKTISLQIMRSNSTHAYPRPQTTWSLFKMEVSMKSLAIAIQILTYLKLLSGQESFRFQNRSKFWAKTGEMWILFRIRTLIYGWFFSGQRGLSCFKTDLSSSYPLLFRTVAAQLKGMKPRWWPSDRCHMMEGLYVLAYICTRHMNGL